jgi:hypothetical protein
VTPQEALIELHTQHDSLRALMDVCEQLADELDDGGGSLTRLTQLLAELRSTFEAHNRFEESLLRPILRRAGVFDELRLDTVISEHVGDHLAIHQRLGDRPTAELRATMNMLRDHLATEERYFARLPRLPP